VGHAVSPRCDTSKKIIRDRAAAPLSSLERTTRREVTETPPSKYPDDTALAAKAVATRLGYADTAALTHALIRGVDNAPHPATIDEGDNTRADHQMYPHIGIMWVILIVKGFTVRPVSLRGGAGCEVEELADLGPGVVLVAGLADCLR